MHFLYILYSEKLDRFYIGETSNLVDRLEKHKSKYYKKSFTSKALDWKLVLTKEVSGEKEALFLERFIKRMKSKKFIQKLIDKPEILTDILNKK